MRSLAVVLVLAALVACGGDDESGECAPPLEGGFVMHMKLARGGSICPAGGPIVVGNDGQMQLEPGCAPVETESATCIVQTMQRCHNEHGCTMDYTMWLDGKGGSWQGEYSADIVCPSGERATCAYDVEVEDR